MAAQMAGQQVGQSLEHGRRKLQISTWKPRLDMEVLGKLWASAGQVPLLAEIQTQLQSSYSRLLAERSEKLREASEQLMEVWPGFGCCCADRSVEQLLPAKCVSMRAAAAFESEMP